MVRGVWSSDRSVMPERYRRGPVTAAHCDGEPAIAVVGASVGSPPRPTLSSPPRLSARSVVEPVAERHVGDLVVAAGEDRETFGFTEIPYGADGVQQWLRNVRRWQRAVRR